MLPTRLLHTAGAVGAAGLLTLTAACGGSSSDAGSSAGSSSDPSSDSSSGAVDTAALTTTNIFSRIIAAQKKAGSYAYTLTTKAAGQSVTGAGHADVSGAKPEADGQVTFGGQQIRTVTSDGLIYLKGGAFGTEKWIKIDPKSKGGLGAMFSGSSDPSQQLAALSDAAKVTKGDTQQVGGVDTTEYDVSIPSSALTKTNPTMKQLASALPKTIEYDLFVDKDDLVRKVDSDFEVSGQKLQTEITFSDYGKKVSIQVPPASQTTTKFNLRSRLGAVSS